MAIQYLYGSHFSFDLTAQIILICCGPANNLPTSAIVCVAERDGYFETLGGVSAFEKIVVEWNGEIRESEVVVLKSWGFRADSMN